MTNTITQNTAVTINETHTNVTCNGYAMGAIDISTNGGTWPYVYSWSNGDNNRNLSGVIANTYTVTATDANGCSGTQSATIIQPTPISVTFNYNNVNCNGGADGNIDLTVSGATRAIHSYGIMRLLPKTYTTLLQATIPLSYDANNCVTSANMSITQPINLTVVTNTHVNVSCHGGSNGSIDISIVGGTIPFHVYME